MQATVKTVKGRTTPPPPQTPPSRPRQGSRGRSGRGDLVVTTRVGLLMPAGLTLDDWASVGRRLSRVADSTSWCLGDWLAHGQRRFSGRYQKTAEEVGLNTQTLRNYAWLARKFDLDRRRPALSLQHHAEVAALPVPAQDRWLDLAEQGHWSRNELRRRMRHGTPSGDPPGAQPTPRPEHAGYLPRLPVGPDELARWRRAAGRTATDLDTWMVRTLNDAARRETDPPPAVAD